MVLIFMVKNMKKYLMVQFSDESDSDQSVETKM